jgi:hypothetical protein
VLQTGVNAIALLSPVHALWITVRSFPSSCLCSPNGNSCDIAAAKSRAFQAATILSLSRGLSSEDRLRIDRSRHEQPESRQDFSRARPEGFAEPWPFPQTTLAQATRDRFMKAASFITHHPQSTCLP